MLNEILKLFDNLNTHVKIINKKINNKIKIEIHIYVYKKLKY